MSKHTPGPWKLFQVGDAIEHLCPATQDGASILTITQEGNTAFAAVFNDADARLIAVAPDLLAELVKITDAYAKAMKDAGVSHYPEALVVVRNARAAIAKATGGNNV